MSGAKSLPIAAAIAGLLAAIGISVKLATSTNPLEARVDRLLAHESELAASDPFGNLTSRIEEFYTVRHDAEFAKLPTVKQKKVGDCLTELQDLARYQAFEKQINEIPDPKTAQSRTQLNGIEDRLRQLEVPERVPDAVKNGAAIQRREEWLEDVAAIQVTFDQLEANYSQLIHEAKNILLTKNEPQLPDRIQKVLTFSKNLKTPDNKDQLVSGSQRVRYSVVFQLSEIEKLIRDWNKLKETLEPAVKAKTP